jgi:transposase
MKVITKKQDVNPEKTVDVAFDVGKDKLNSAFEIGASQFSDEFRNSGNAIKGKLKSYMELARQHGMEGLRVLVEPSGGYEKALLKAAHGMGCRTAYVSGEASCKFRMVVHGDPGKTDERDALPLLAVASKSKLLTHRVLPADYELLREINREYDWVSERRVEIRCEIHALLIRLFPDFPMESDFLYEAVGMAVAREYGWNPERIVKGGRERLQACMKAASSRTHEATISKIWEAAVESGGLHDGGGAVEFLAERMRRLYEEFCRLDGQRLALRDQLEEVYLRLRQEDVRLPLGADGVIKTYMLARIVAETGPLSDFRDIQQLYRFAGINLCERKSGKYKGKTKISRKGRVALRRVLGIAILRLVRSDGIYGAWYHTDNGGTKKSKGMAALMRKFLKMIFGWYKSGRGFDRGRVFTSAGEYAAKAA